jgi:hypothetical protein
MSSRKGLRLIVSLARLFFNDETLRLAFSNSLHGSLSLLNVQTYIMRQERNGERSDTQRF